MAATLELAIIETLDSREVFTGDNPTLRSLVDLVIAEVDDFNADVTTQEGRDKIKAIAYKISRSKTALDGLGKDFVAEIKARTKSIDEQRKGMRETLEELQKLVRRPLTEWEAEEERKKEALKQRLNDLSQMATATITDLDLLEGGLKNAQSEVIDETWCPLQEMAQKAKDAAISHLTTHIANIKQQAAEREELDRLRADVAERDKKEAAEREAHAAAEREQKLKEATEAREAKIKQDAADEAAKAAEQAEKDKVAAVEAEKSRAAAETKRTTDEESARAANKKHRGAINNKAVEALVAFAGCSELAAKAVVTSIAKGQINGVKISY